jgi:hypothetical protein
MNVETNWDTSSSKTVYGAFENIPFFVVSHMKAAISGLRTPHKYFSTLGFLTRWTPLIGNLLLEDGSDLLLEDGSSFLLLE